MKPKDGSSGYNATSILNFGDACVQAHTVHFLATREAGKQTFQYYSYQNYLWLVRNYLFRIWVFPLRTPANHVNERVSNWNILFVRVYKYSL